MTTKSDVVNHANLAMLITTQEGKDRIIQARRFYTIIETEPNTYRLPKDKFLEYVLFQLQEAQAEVMELIQKDYEEQTK